MSKPARRTMKMIVMMVMEMRISDKVSRYQMSLVSARTMPFAMGLGQTKSKAIGHLSCNKKSTGQTALKIPLYMQPSTLATSNGGWFAIHGRGDSKHSALGVHTASTWGFPHKYTPRSHHIIAPPHGREQLQLC
jgi:hypothetical protein